MISQRINPRLVHFFLPRLQPSVPPFVCCWCLRHLHQLPYYSFTPHSTSTSSSPVSVLHHLCCLFRSPFPRGNLAHQYILPKFFAAFRFGALQSLARLLQYRNSPAVVKVMHIFLVVVWYSVFNI